MSAPAFTALPVESTLAPKPQPGLSHAPAVSVLDYRCTAHAGDVGFDEQFEHHTLAYVRKGSFGCDCEGRRFELVPGSVLVGHPGLVYRCSHEHHAGGDECLSFRFDSAVADEFSPRTTWRLGMVPPLAAVAVWGEVAQACALGANDFGLDELGLRLAQALVQQVGPRRSRELTASASDRRRVLRAAQWIASRSAEPLRLELVAAEVSWSPYHFLRLFSRVIGLTPHQYVIRCRLAQAARHLAQGEASITQLALNVGFADLSNFVRSFGRAAGISPTQFRRLAGGEQRARLARLGAPIVET